MSSVLKVLLFLTCLVPTLAWSDSIAIIKPWYTANNPAWFQFSHGQPKEKFVDVVAQRLWKNMAAVLLAHGDRFVFCDIQQDGWQEILSKSKKVICFNIPLYERKWRKIFEELPKEKFFLIQYDPQMSIYYFNKPAFYNFFNKVLTYEDSEVNNISVFKYNYCTLSTCYNPVPFAQKKMFTQISSNLVPQFSHELYSERQKVIQYFEQHLDEGFEFYGRGWPTGTYATYRGSIENKLDTLKNYKFAFCYENSDNIEGYITEKIFDCFIAGCVPIYWGAPNVTQYIPKECFVDRRDFNSMDDLVTYLKTMTPQEYQDKLNAIHKYMNSAPARKFSDAAFRQIFERTLYGSNKSHKVKKK